MRTLALVSVLTGLCLATETDAAGIPSLFNTGVTDTGAVLPDTSIDSHYQLIAAPTGTGLGPDTFVADSSKQPLSTGDWLPNDLVSKWIAPQADQSTFLDSAGVAGTYIYRTTFDLTGFNANTATISGEWATDNTGTDILINGVSTGITNSTQFSAFSAFEINSGFVSGINTLDFFVDNLTLPPYLGDINPSGLRLEMVGTATVPEPTGLAIAALGMLMLPGIGRRRS